MHINILALVGIAGYAGAYPAYPMAPLCKYMWTYLAIDGIQT
jgi:hypothetical protein